MKETHGIEANFGAGIILFCTSTQRILLGKRSPNCGNEPNKWCIFGGMGNVEEQPLECAVREFIEESELIPRKIVSGAIINTKPSNQFKFYTYLATCSKEYDATINHEHTEYGWFTVDEILHKSDLHKEFFNTFSNEEVLKKIFRNSK
jgi:8-oxo-dGTP pyrophosphatase MutT (NUDIX family)